MDDVKISDGRLMICAGGASIPVDLPHPVREILFSLKVCIVRLEAPPGRIFNENVFGLDQAGEIIWTIEAARHVYPDSPYTEIHLDADPRFVWASTWDGAKRKIDVASGRTVAAQFAK